MDETKDRDYTEEVVEEEEDAFLDEIGRYSRDIKSLNKKIKQITVNIEKCGRRPSIPEKKIKKAIETDRQIQING